MDAAERNSFTTGLTSLSQETSEFLQPIMEWAFQKGTRVELRRNAIPIRQGLVDDVTYDGSMFWISQQGAEGREIIHRDDGYEIWSLQ